MHLSLDVTLSMLARLRTHMLLQLLPVRRTIDIVVSGFDLTYQLAHSIISHVEMTSHLKRSLELLESDHSEPTLGKCKRGSKRKIHNSLSLKKGSRENSDWNSDEGERKRKVDLTEANVSILNFLSSRQIDESTANKILIRAGKKRTEETHQSKDERTVFTEEDFATFEKEYFVGGK